MLEKILPKLWGLLLTLFRVLTRRDKPIDLTNELDDDANTIKLVQELDSDQIATKPPTPRKSSDDIQ